MLSSLTDFIASSGAEGGSSGAAGADAKAGGMRLYLSQIREWVVEYSAETLFISMRTDVAWYRLVTCAYLPAPTCVFWRCGRQCS